MTEQHLPDEGQASFESVVEGGEAAGSPDPAAEPPDVEQPHVEQPDLVAKISALTNDLQRLQAEYVNYKRRVDRDRELVFENARLAVLSTLLPVLDAIDRAREHGELHGGFKAVAESLERVVAGQGLVKFGAAGDEFDPRFHEALMHRHSAEVTTTTAGEVISSGYKIGERVVRPAQVVAVDPEPELSPRSEEDQQAGTSVATGGEDHGEEDV